MIGRRFGKLVVLEIDKIATQNNQRHATSYLCICDCGNTKTVRRGNLTRGSTTSCGCVVKEENKKNNEKKVIDLVGQRFGKGQFLNARTIKVFVYHYISIIYVLNGRKVKT